MSTTHWSHNNSQNNSSDTLLYEDCLKVRYSDIGHFPWDNPDGIVSSRVSADVYKIRNYILMACAFIGIPANVINMAVFFKQSLKDRVNLCLFSLSLADEIFLLITVMTHSDFTFVDKHFGPLSTFLTNNKIIALLGCLLVSLVISAIIACERCFCVLSPLKYHSMLRTRTMAVIIAAVYLLGLVLFFIVSFRYHIGCMHEVEFNIVYRSLVVQGFYKEHQQLIDTLDSVVLGAGLIGVSTIVVVTATIITAIRLRQVVTWRAETSSSLSAREVALTKMLIGASVLFIVCNSPNCVFRVACLIVPGLNAGAQYHHFYITLLWITEGFSVVNSSFNIFVYYKMGSKYRETLWTLFCRKENTQKA